MCSVQKAFTYSQCSSALLTFPSQWSFIPRRYMRTFENTLRSKNKPIACRNQVNSTDITQRFQHWCREMMSTYNSSLRELKAALDQLLCAVVIVSVIVAILLVEQCSIMLYKFVSRLKDASERTVRWNFMLFLTTQPRKPLSMVLILRFIVLYIQTEIGIDRMNESLSLSLLWMQSCAPIHIIIARLQWMLLAIAQRFSTDNSVRCNVQRGFGEFSRCTASSN